jgi:hypothetical protein
MKHPGHTYGGFVFRYLGTGYDTTPACAYGGILLPLMVKGHNH